MINTITLMSLYAEFCEQGTIPMKPSKEGFIRMCLDEVFITVFMGWCLTKGYTTEAFDEYFLESSSHGDQWFVNEVDSAAKALFGE